MVFPAVIRVEPRTLEYYGYQIEKAPSLVPGMGAGIAAIFSKISPDLKTLAAFLTFILIDRH